MLNKGPVRVLIVDDSVTIRKVLRHLLESDKRFQVVAEAAKPDEALKIIDTQPLDLITMDLHLPQMTGADLIKIYMQRKRIPTVVISSLRAEESHLVLESLENGATDYFQKLDRTELLAKRLEILDRLFQAANSKVTIAPKVGVKKPTISFREGIVLIGSSTGGTEAVKTLLSQLGDQIPPILIVQHIPPFFSEAFAQRLNKHFAFEVKEARHGDEIKNNRVLIAPGGIHMKIAKKENSFIVVLDDSQPVNRHKPSVDVLFHSAAKDYLGTKVGIILTGMGADGADGLLALRTKGAYTIAQNEETCVVFGMPKEAIKRGAATEICGLDEMAKAIQNGFTKLRKTG